LRAEVVLEGRATSGCKIAMIGYLASGKITANVPRRAFSFAILSPKVDFVDLGTSFGVNVAITAHELHVFQGEVLCSETNQRRMSRRDVIHVTASKRWIRHGRRRAHPPVDSFRCTAPRPETRAAPCCPLSPTFTPNEVLSQQNRLSATKSQKRKRPPRHIGRNLAEAK